MYLEEYKRWLEADLEDADLNPELARIEGNDEEIKDRFAVSLNSEPQDFVECLAQEQTV